MRAIDARSIDRLRSEHCKSILLTFKQNKIENKYVTEPDKMLSNYFICSFIIYFGSIFIQFMLIDL